MNAELGNFMLLGDTYASMSRNPLHSDTLRAMYADLAEHMYACADRIERAQIEAADQLRLPMEISCRTPFAREVV